MEIRSEKPGEAAAIRRLVEAAFLGAPHASGGEGALVDALRAAGALSLSLVAEEGGALLGHVGFSPLGFSDGAEGWFALAPLATRADRRGEGIGAALVRAGLARLEAAGAAGCAVLGDPAYYARFGFAADPQMRFPGAPPEAFRRILWRGPAPQGEALHHAAFSGL